MLGYSCQTVGSELEDFKEIREVFSSEEIKDLKEIIKFFQESICELTDSIDNNHLLECYEDYFEKIKQSAETGEMEIQISSYKQMDFMGKLKQTSFDQIWARGKTLDKALFSNISFKNKGKYLEFLNRFGEVNESVKLYVDDFISAGDLSPGMVANVLHNSQKFDINDKRIKLFVAVHYLTLNAWRNQ